MKKFLLLFSISLFTYSLYSQIPTSGLVSHWSFNGNANDLTNNANHGTVYGATLTTDRFGNLGKSYAFNGTNNYIETPISNLIVNEYSYSAWALTNSIPNAGTGTYVLFVGTTGGSQCINTNNNVGVNNGWGGNGYNSTSPVQYITYQGSNLTTGQWVHIVLTRSSNAMKLYINCNLVKTDSTTYNTLPYYGSSQILKIGTRDNNTGFFDGKIDDIRIYNRAINPNEVCALYNETDPLTVDIKENNLTKNLLSVYPVPATNILTLNFNNNIHLLDKLVEINVFSTQGVLVHKILLNKNELQNIEKIDLGNLIKGFYYLNITSGNFSENLYFIKE